MEMVEPRRECQQITAVYPDGTVKVCGSHVYEVEMAAHVVYCSVCGRHSFWGTTVGVR